METVFLLARHGLTEWNVQGRYQGQRECALSEEGKLESDALARALAPVSLAAVYSSPLSRAVQTAQTVARFHGLPVTVLPQLTEICHGHWEGKLVDEVARQWGELLNCWRKTPYQVRMPGGENLAEVEKRVWPVLERLAAEHSGQTALLVTHDTPIRVILRRILGLAEDGFWRLRLDSAGITRVGFRVLHGFRVLSLNDVCHLRGLPGHDQEAL
jgi:broad specificity phosphatase PhoE